MTWTMTLAQNAEAGTLSGHFTWIDWVVLVGYLVLVSIIGVKLAGKQENMEDFFRGGGKLPWYAVSASMIATAISAVTFVGVPAIAFAGNMTYLQLGIIAGVLPEAYLQPL
jgi:solute:Na+ symporter, SSS family